MNRHSNLAVPTGVLAAVIVGACSGSQPSGAGADIGKAGSGATNTSSGGAATMTVAASGGTKNSPPAGSSIPDADGSGAPPSDDSGVSPANDAEAGADAAVPADGCGTTGVSIVAEATGHFTADDTTVYFEDTSCLPTGRGCFLSPGPLKKVPRCGGDPTTLVPHLDSVLYSLVDGGPVVYGLETTKSASSLAVARVHKDTGALDRISAAIATSPSNFAYLYAASGTAFVYVDASGVMSTIAVDASSPRTLGTPAVLPAMLAATDRAVFWSDGSDLYRAALDGTWAPVKLQHAAAISPPTVFPAGDSAFATVDGTLYSLPAAGTQVTSRLFPDAPKLWDQGYLYEEVTVTNTNVMRERFDGVGTREIVLRAGDLRTVRNGMMYFGFDKYILRRGSAPESVADPLDTGREKSALEVPGAGIVTTILPTADGGFVRMGLRASLDAASDGALNTPFIEAYAADGRQKTAPHIPAAAYGSIGTDAAGNFVTVEGDVSRANWARYDATGRSLGSGPTTLSGAQIAVGDSGRFALFSLSVGSSTTVELHAADGTLVKSVQTGGPTPTSAAVAPSDHVFVSFSGYGGATCFGEPVAADGSCIASFSPSGDVEWAMPMPGLSVDRVRATPDGSVVFLGSSWARYTLGGVQTVAVPGRANTVVGRLDATGATVSLRSYEGAAALLAVDGKGNALVAGGASQRDFVDLIAPNVYGARTNIAFVARFDPRGRLLGVGRNGASDVFALAVDKSGSALVGTQDGSVIRFDMN